MHQFKSIAGDQHKGCIPIPIKSKDDISKADKYYKAIEIAKATCKYRIMLFREDDDKLNLLNPFDIINEPTCFVVVNINDRTLKSCARDGLIDVAKWMCAYGCEWNNYILMNGASNGYIKFAKCTRENECIWDGNIISNAAFGGHIEFAKWALENGCPWGEYVISSAAQNGHIEFAKWARENGCPWGNNVIWHAAWMS